MHGRYSILSDEMFFQTIIMNSAFCKRTSPGNLHWVAWRPPGPNAPKCLHGDVVDWCGVSPSLVWDIDVTNMLESKMLFARKFDDSNTKSRLAKAKIKEANHQ